MSRCRFGLLVVCCLCVCSSWAAGRTDVSLAGSGWTVDGLPVSVPHTWNAEDAADGLGGPARDAQSEWEKGYSAGAETYVRKEVVYRRSLPDPEPGRRHFVKCLGASMKAEVRVNGQVLGRHVGAFTAFAFEATAALRPTGNVLEIAVSNVYDPDVQPLNADFSVYGGLYRDVRWITTDKVCIDPVSDGAVGVVLDPDPDTGDVVARVSVLGGTNEVQRFHFDWPELWSPENPKLYAVDVVVRQNGAFDSIRVPFGFRKVEFRKDGFYLNGVRRQLRGVNRHQDREGKGWAVSPDDERADVVLMKAMGADAVRASHYPQSPGFYSLCDEHGLLVWAELPNVNRLCLSAAARENGLREAREMVAQHRNHPSVFVWGIFNEIWNKAMIGEGAPEPRLRELRDLIRSLDPSRRVVAASSQPTLRELNGIPEELGFNLYPGWYGGTADEMGKEVERCRSLNGRACIAVSEYGAGGCVQQHGDPLAGSPKPDGPFHPEEYQVWHHAANYRQIKDNPRVWGAFVWAMFDFGADARHEGACNGRNDKGLVTWDRQTVKAAFWFYRANWTAVPVLRFANERQTETDKKTLNVLAISNCGETTLTVNGVSFGSRQPDTVKTALWRDVPLKPGENVLCLKAGSQTTTHVIWCSASGGRAHLKDPVPVVSSASR